jgi:hypothetical protein
VNRDFRVIRNRIEYPRSWVVHGARATRPETEAETGAGTRAETMREILYAADPIWNHGSERVYDPRQVAWVSPADLAEIGHDLSGLATGPSETVTVTYPSPQQAVLEVTLDSPGLVVLADVFYPGWSLTIDGKPAPCYRVNSMMRGAAAPAGRHRLVYTYLPVSFRIGRAASIAGLAAMLIVGLACVRWPIDRVVAGTGSWPSAGTIIPT